MTAIICQSGIINVLIAATHSRASRKIIRAKKSFDKQGIIKVDYKHMIHNLNNAILSFKKLKDGFEKASKALREFNYVIFKQHLDLHNDYPVRTVEIEGFTLPEGSDDFDIEGITYWPEGVEIQWTR